MPFRANLNSILKYFFENELIFSKLKQAQFHNGRRRSCPAEEFLRHMFVSLGDHYEKGAEIKTKQVEAVALFEDFLPIEITKELI